MGSTPHGHSWQWGQARARLQRAVVIQAVPLLVLGGAAVMSLGFSWPALLWGLGMGVLSLVAPAHVILLPGRLAGDLVRPARADSAAAAMYLRAGLVVELARVGVVMLTDMRISDAIWLGLGIQLFNVLHRLAVNTLMVLLRPSPLDLEQAAEGRAAEVSYGRGLLRFGRATLVQVGLSLLLALSPWLAFVTVPLGTLWEGLVGWKGHTPLVPTAR